MSGNGLQRPEIAELGLPAGPRRHGYACLSFGFAMYDLGHHVVPARVGAIAEKLLGPPLHREPEPGRLLRIVAVALEVAEVPHERTRPDALVEPPAQKLHDLVIWSCRDWVGLCGRRWLALSRGTDARIRRHKTTRDSRRFPAHASGTCL
jgi:hypothetical protein